LTTETKFKTHSTQLNSTQPTQPTQPTKQTKHQSIQYATRTQTNTTAATTVYLDPEEGISYRKCIDTFPVHGVERP
jgi:hypothetical protein